MGGQLHLDGVKFTLEPFFTVPNGYKMTIIVYCNGDVDGAETHVSVLAQFLDVPYKKLAPCSLLMSTQEANGCSNNPSIGAEGSSVDLPDVSSGAQVAISAPLQCKLLIYFTFYI